MYTHLYIHIYIRVRLTPQIYPHNVLKILVLRMGLRNMCVNFFENRFTLKPPKLRFFKNPKIIYIFLNIPQIIKILALDYRKYYLEQILSHDILL